jgi:hypothetical protein
VVAKYEFESDRPAFELLYVEAQPALFAAAAHFQADPSPDGFRACHWALKCFYRACWCAARATAWEGLVFFRFFFF